jgi:hypothetical protein
MLSAALAIRPDCGSSSAIWGAAASVVELAKSALSKLLVRKKREKRMRGYQSAEKS